MTTVHDQVAMLGARRISSRAVVLIGLGWLVIAAGGGMGFLSPLRPPTAARLVVGLTAIVLGAGWCSRGFRGWLSAIEARCPLGCT
jgi:hypothetical protein